MPTAQTYQAKMFERNAHLPTRDHVQKVEGTQQKYATIPFQLSNCHQVAQIRTRPYRRHVRVARYGRTSKDRGRTKARQNLHTKPPPPIPCKGVGVVRRIRPRRNTDRIRTRAEQDRQTRLCPIVDVSRHVQVEPPAVARRCRRRGRTVTPERART